jgi:hypothetical protein
VRWSFQFDEVLLIGGNRNDITKLLPRLDAVPAIRGRVGRRGAAVTRRNGESALLHLLCAAQTDCRHGTPPLSPCCCRTICLH